MGKISKAKKFLKILSQGSQEVPPENLASFILTAVVSPDKTYSDQFDDPGCTGVCCNVACGVSCVCLVGGLVERTESDFMTISCPQEATRGLYSNLKRKETVEGT